MPRTPANGSPRRIRLALGKLAAAWHRASTLSLSTATRPKLRALATFRLYTAASDLLATPLALFSAVQAPFPACACHGIAGA